VNTGGVGQSVKSAPSSEHSNVASASLLENAYVAAVSRPIC
jgi:hypothetical protein